MKNKMTFIIDVDNTILSSKKSGDKFDYVNSTPIRSVINKINKLYDQGHNIVLFTARGMRTFKGDINEIEMYHRPILEKWLEKNAVKYHHLRFGKPWGQNCFYIDDKSLTINQFLECENHKEFDNSLKKNYSRISEELKSPHKVNVIIPAAGMATRMRPLSNNISKTMLSINGKPILKYIIDELESYDEIEEIVIVKGQNADIEEYINSNKHRLNKKYIITQQYELTGPLKAIWDGYKELTNKENSLLVWLGDTICLEKFDFSKNSFLVTSKVEDYKRWCLVDNDGIFYDKPLTDPNTRDALIGIYYFKHNVIKTLNNSITNSFFDKNTKEPHQIKTLLLEHMKQKNTFDIINTNLWYDCGELHTYYESKARLISNSSRKHNTISIDLDCGILIKSAETKKYMKKIDQEKNWYKSLNEKQSMFVPRILESDILNGQLKMSWESGIPLNELCVNEHLNIEQTKLILKKILKIINTIFHINIQHYKPSENVSLFNHIKEYFYLKNIQRLEKKIVLIDNIEKTFINKYKSFFECLLQDLENTDMLWSDCIHGDLHFGNILFSPYNGEIKFIDPRGSFSTIVGTEGDPRLDIAKLYHDIYVGYNHILLEQYKIINDEVILYQNEQHRKQLIDILDVFVSKYHYGSPRLFKKMGIGLVLSCLQFHKEDDKRIHAFITRCLNLIRSEKF